jgi:hypothetical protein
MPIDQKQIEEWKALTEHLWAGPWVWNPPNQHRDPRTTRPTAT